MQPIETNMNNDNDVRFHNQLLEKLRSCFNDSELKDICFTLEIEYEDLKGETRQDKTRELIKYTMRHGRIDELVIECMRLRPTVPWKEIECISWLDWVTQEKPSTTQIVEKAAKVCELLHSYHEKNSWHPTLQADRLLIDENGNISFNDQTKTRARTDPQSDIQGLGSLLYQSLTDNELPSDKKERETSLLKVNDISPSLVRMIVRATNDPPDWPTDTPLQWAELLRATQRETLLIDQLSPEKKWSLKEALNLVIDIGEEMQIWREAGEKYLSPSAELIEYDAS